MHTAEILWLLAWPVSIYITYRIVLFVLKHYEKRIAGKKIEPPVTDS